MGLIGEEFKTARTHLLKNLDGCIAWKDPAQAEAQRERLKKKREIEREQMQEGVQNDSVDHEMNMQHM